MVQDQDSGSFGLSPSEELQCWACELWESGDDLELAQAIVSGHLVLNVALSVWETSKDHPEDRLALEQAASSTDADSSAAARYVLGWDQRRGDLIGRGSSS